MPPVCLRLLTVKNLIKTLADQKSVDHLSLAMCLRCVCVCCKLRTTILFIPFLLGFHLMNRLGTVFSVSVLKMTFCLFREFRVHIILPLLDLHQFGKITSNKIPLNIDSSLPQISRVCVIFKIRFDSIFH